MSQRRTLDTRSKRLDEVLTRGNRGDQPLLHPMSSHTVAILTKRCCDALLPVRSISSQFRAMSNKQMPKEPSYFVSSILRPVKVFLRPDLDLTWLRSRRLGSARRPPESRRLATPVAARIAASDSALALERPPSSARPSSIPSARHLGLLHPAHVAADGRRLLRWESHAVVVVSRSTSVSNP
ncbi:hypothetical protein C8R47DRAFT_260726 [Mycena vitilis]|nr:hypothetical protein C8R47DRAFT_260726 [Mycena vitilis]